MLIIPLNIAHRGRDPGGGLRAAQTGGAFVERRRVSLSACRELLSGRTELDHRPLLARAAIGLSSSGRGLLA